MGKVFKVIFCGVLSIITTHIYANDEYIEQTDDKIFEVQLSAQEILKKAEGCIIKNVKNESVMLVGTSTGYSGIFDPSAKRNEAITTIPAGSVISHKDLESGIIFANSRIDVKADLVTYSIQSMIDFAAKDNKFKMSHKDILYLQKNVGYGTPDSYKKLPKKGKWMSHLNPNTLKALDEVLESVSVCIRTTPSSNW